jgi:hypothetical protein
MSPTIISSVIGILVLLFKISGIEVAPEKVQSAVEVVVLLISLITVYVRRIQKGDVSLAGVKK